MKYLVLFSLEVDVATPKDAVFAAWDGLTGMAGRPVGVVVNTETGEALHVDPEEDRA